MSEYLSERKFSARSNRMLFFAEKVRIGMSIQFVLGTEIDLVRKALDELEAELVPEHEEYRKERQKTQEEIDKEIEEAGGIDAWCAKVGSELGLEDEKS
jgi:hypothetical protein